MVEQEQPESSAQDTPAWSTEAAVKAVLEVMIAFSEGFANYALLRYFTFVDQRMVDGAGLELLRHERWHATYNVALGAVLSRSDTNTHESGEMLGAIKALCAKHADALHGSLKRPREHNPLDNL